MYLTLSFLITEEIHQPVKIFNLFPDKKHIFILGLGKVTLKKYFDITLEKYNRLENCDF